MATQSGPSNSVRSLRREAADELFKRVAGMPRSPEGLRNQLRVLQAIVNSIGEGIVLADEHGRFLLFNPAAERLVGLGAVDSDPARWSEHYGIVYPDEKTPFPSEQLPLFRAIRGEPTDEVEMFVRNARLPEGVHLTVSGRPLRDETGAVRAGGVILREITERRRAEQVLRAAHDELEDRVRERTRDLSRTNRLLRREVRERKRAEAGLARRAEDLARSNAELEQFAYVASHDLKEPLRMVISYVQLLERRYKGRLDSAADDFIDFAVDGALRMQDLVDGLLAYSRVGAARRAFGPVDCERVLEDTLSDLQDAIKEAGASITHDPLPTVPGDATLLGDLLRNLMVNGIKFHGSDPPRVHIGASRRGRDWLFSVTDNGIGIERAHADRIFAIFQRLHSRAQYPGTGIGLAICKKIAERHGGRIWVEPQREGGSSFRFTIPAKEVNRNDYVGTKDHSTDATRRPGPTRRHAPREGVAAR